MRLLLTMSITVFLISATDARADFYKWVDRDGRENYTNSLEKVPPEYREQAAAVETSEGRVMVGKKPTEPAYSSTAGKEHRDKYGRGEEYWRKRAESLRRQLADYQDEHDFLVKQEEERLERERNSVAKKKKSTSNFEKKKAKLEKKIAQARRRLDVELPEEARKADAYPGWLRE